MKKTVLFILAGIVALLASCVKETEHQRVEGPVYITVSMDPETKATLADSDGAFAFSSGDAIKIYDGNGVFSGTTTSTTNSGNFAMDSGFASTGFGYAGFPASLVSNITGSGVTFVLPSSYSYTDVGGADPDAAKVISPMIGTYTGGGKISLKQAGAVLRFRLTNVAAGSITFTFGVNVTGSCTITTPSGTDEGILPSHLSQAGKTITVVDVPAVTTGNYIYITLPVPTGVKPENIAVFNASDYGNNHIAFIMSSETPLNRACGYKSNIALADAPGTLSGIFSVSSDKRVYFSKGNLQWSGASGYGWRFALKQYTYIGEHVNNTTPTYVTGNYMDLFCWGSSGLNGVAPNRNTDYKEGTENLTGNNDWGNNSITNGGATTGVWRTLSKDEWVYLFSHHTHGWATVEGVPGRVIRPDGITKTIESSYSEAAWAMEEAAGSIFLPAAGKRLYSHTSSEWVNLVIDSGYRGYYWSSTYNGADGAYCLDIFNILPYDEARRVGFSVRLVRDIGN